METIDQLIHGKWIITGEENNRILKNHALAIKDGKLYDLLSSKEAKEKYKPLGESHYSSHAILPGLINCHTHLAMNLFRGLADDLELMDWLNHHIWPAENKWLSHDLVYTGSLLAMAEMIRGGITCFNDMYFFLHATAQAAELTGMRGFIGITVIDFPTPWAKTTEEYFAKGLEFYDYYKNHDRITPTMAPHSTYSVSINNLLKVKEIAEQYRLKINLHLQEAPTEIEQALQKHQKRPLEQLEEIGMISPDLIAIHMTQINDADLSLLQARKPQIVHCPESNMKLASGVCPVAALTQRGINVSLGTDGAASNNDLDMFGEMRTAALLGKVTLQDPKALKATQTFKMATLNGAKTLGIDKITGSLEIGKWADCIAVDLEQIETQPLYDLISQIVYATPRQQVTDVWVAGKQILKNRKLVTLDEKELLHKIQIWGNKIKN